MSRNKIILTLAAIIILYLLLPDKGTTGLIRAYMLAVVPYIIIFVIVWLFVTINILRKAMSKLSSDINDVNVFKVAKLMRLTFDVKRFMGEQNLIDLYKRVNFRTSVSLNAKQALYNALIRKRLNIPVPSSGKSGQGNKNKKKKKK